MYRRPLTAFGAGGRCPLRALATATGAASAPADSTSTKPCLHVFTNAFNRFHLQAEAAETSFGSTNRPFYRRRLIHAALQQLPDVAIILVRPETSLKAARTVHHHGMLHYLDTAYDRFLALWQQGQCDEYFSSNSTSRRDGDSNSFSAPECAPRADHNQRYTEDVHSQCVYFSQDRSTPLNPYTAKSLRGDLATVIAAVNKLCSNEVTQAQEATATVYALTTHPGHHAFKDSYGGFCYINTAAYAARRIQHQLQMRDDKHAIGQLKASQRKRVAVLDVDYHSGNGTQSVLYTDPSILFVSLHMDTRRCYPYTSGFPDQTGGKHAPDTTLNIQLNKGTEWSSYKQHLQRALDRITEFKPEALIVSLGLDTLKGDPEAAPAGGLALYVANYAEMGQMLRAVKLPLLFVQEGGYYLQQVPYAAVNAVMGHLVHEEAPADATTDDNHPLLRKRSKPVRSGYESQRHSADSG